MAIIIRLELNGNRDGLNFTVSNDDEIQDAAKIKSVANFTISFNATSNTENNKTKNRTNETVFPNQNLIDEKSNCNIIDLTDEPPDECQDLTDYFIVDKILGNRFNNRTKQHEFLLKLKNCVTVDDSWNSPSNSQLLDLADPDGVLYVQKSADLKTSYQTESTPDVSLPVKESQDSLDLGEDVIECAVNEEDGESKEKVKTADIDLVENVSQNLNEEIDRKSLFNIDNPSRSSEKEEKKVFDEIPTSVDESKFKCKYCGSSFESLLRWRKHCKWCYVRSTQLFSCSECPRAFANKYHLQRHLHVHSNFTVYRCAMCGFVYGSLSEIKKHEKEAHFLRYQRRCPTSVGVKSKWKQIVKKPPLKCSVCCCDFPDETTFDLHPCKPEKTKLFACTRCNRTFAEISGLRKHEQAHAEFRCSICNHVFKAAWRLHAHEESHRKDSTMSTPHTCFECKKYFSTKAGAMFHRNFFHSSAGNSSLTCIVCGNILKSKVSLRCHMFRHTDERPHQCKMCEYKTIQRISLQKHMWSKHRIPLKQKSNLANFS